MTTKRKDLEKGECVICKKITTRHFQLGKKIKKFFACKGCMPYRCG